MENKNVFNSFLKCTRLLLSRIFLGRLFHRVGPAQANARRPKRSKFTFGTSRSNPPAVTINRACKWVTIHGETPRDWSLLGSKRDN